MAVHIERFFGEPETKTSMFTRLKTWYFTRRWEKHYATWKPTRQRRKAFRRDLVLYLETGAWPW